MENLEISDFNYYYEIDEIIKIQKSKSENYQEIKEKYNLDDNFDSSSFFRVYLAQNSEKIDDIKKFVAIYFLAKYFRKIDTKKREIVKNDYYPQALECYNKFLSEIEILDKINFSEWLLQIANKFKNQIHSEIKQKIILNSILTEEILDEKREIRLREWNNSVNII